MVKATLDTYDDDLTEMNQTKQNQLIEFETNLNNQEQFNSGKEESEYE